MASTCSSRSCLSSVRCFTATATASSPLDTSAMQSLRASPCSTVERRSSLNSCLIVQWPTWSSSVWTTSFGNSVSCKLAHSRDNEAFIRATFSANFSTAYKRTGNRDSVRSSDKFWVKRMAALTDQRMQTADQTWSQTTSVKVQLCQKRNGYSIMKTESRINTCVQPLTNQTLNLILALTVTVLLDSTQ